MGLEDRELLPVLEGDSPFDREEVEDTEVVVLAERVVLGVVEGVPLPLCVAVPVGVGVAPSLPVAEGLTPATLKEDEVGVADRASTVTLRLGLL